MVTTKQKPIEDAKNKEESKHPTTENSSVNNGRENNKEKEQEGYKTSRKPLAKWQ